MCTIFLNKDFSKPQQLSTYALTLFNYKTEVNGQKVLVGEYFCFTSGMKERLLDNLNHFE